MPTTLHKIELPSLVNSNFGVNLKNVFENIDSNFQKLSSLGLTTGAAGKPSVWIPYNLNSVFCTELSPSTLSSSYLPAEVIEKIQDDYDKYKAITNRSAYMYVLECILMYNDMLEAIWTDPVDIQYNLTEDDIDTLPEGTEPGEHYWKQKWEKDIELNIDDLRHNEDSDSYTKLYNKIIEVCNVNRAARGLTCCGRTTDSTSENFPITNGNAKMQEYLYDGSHEGPYLPFLPGAIMVAGNMDDAIGGYTKIGTLSHIYIDPRFRSPYVIMGKLTDEELTSLEAATDQSCVVYGTGTYDTDIDNYRLKFDYSYSFPRIHCQDGEFYLKVNDIATNIPLTGRTGKAGKDSQFAIVKLSAGLYTNDEPPVLIGSEDNYLNKNTYRSISNTIGAGNKYPVENTIPDSQNWEDKQQVLDGCPALVFPPDNFIPSSYTSVYWMTHLEIEQDNNSPFYGRLVAYCGRENLVEVTLYDHSFAGMMMGLDMYERSIAVPNGNQPWYKPRGLMLPIGSRYVDTNNEWRPWTPGNQSNDNAFSAHLIYSKGGSPTSKKELHISSVDDYRKIGAAESTAGWHMPPYGDSSIVDNTKLFIDEPTIITNYGKTGGDNRGKVLFEVDGGAAIIGFNDGTYTANDSSVPAELTVYDITNGLCSSSQNHNHVVTYSYENNTKYKNKFVSGNQNESNVYSSPYEIIFPFSGVSQAADAPSTFGGNCSTNTNTSDYIGFYIKRALKVGSYLDVENGIGCSYIRANSLISSPNIVSQTILGRHFVKFDCQPGQILLANGYATQKQIGNSSSPIRLKAKYGDGSEHTVNLTYHNMSGDNTSYFQNTEPLKCGDRMEYVGGGVFKLKGNLPYSKDGHGDYVYIEDIAGCNNSWDNDLITKALNPLYKTHNLTVPEVTVTTSGGNTTYSDTYPLKGGYIFYKMGNVVIAKVAIACNGPLYSLNNGLRTHGLPIRMIGDDNNRTPTIDLFLTKNSATDSNNYQLSCDLTPKGDSTVNNPLPKPLYTVSQYWAGMVGVPDSEDSNKNWNQDTASTKVGQGGVACAIDENGHIKITCASPSQLFTWYHTRLKEENLQNKRYIEFNFIYPVADVGSESNTTLNTPSHYVYTGELEAETGKPVVTDMSDTSVWQLADEFEGDSSEITLDVMTTYVGDGESSDPTLYGDSNWTFQNYDDYVAEHQEPEEPFQTEYNYIYTGTLTGGEPDVTDLTDDTVWFAADEYEGTHGDITARVKATYEGSDRIQHGPGTYNEREWDFDLVLEPHTHYWKCEGTSLPSEGMEMVVGNQVQAVNSVNVSVADYSYEEPDPEWFEDTEVWGLISVTATAKDLSDYTIKYRKANTGAGIEADSWSAKTNASEVTTYQWLGGDDYDIYRYLEQTRMAYYYEGWHGALFDLANNYKKNQNLSYEGFRGKIEISTGDSSMLSTTLPADMTIDCWNDDLTDHILDHYTISINNVQATLQGSLSISDHTITIVKSLSPIEWNSNTGFGPSEQYIPGGTNSDSHTPTEVTPSTDDPTTPGDTRP